MSKTWYIKKGLLHCDASAGGTPLILEDNSTELVVPEGVKKLGYHVFYGNENLTRVRLPDSLTVIDESAFMRCSNLKEVNIPASVMKMGWGAFGYCSSLTSITIPASVTEIEACAFIDCTSLQNITLSEGVTKIHGSAFAKCTSLESIMLPASVSEIGTDVFYECKNLTGIVIPQSVTVIKNKAFFGCERLQSVVLSDGLKRMGNEVFRGCTMLQEIAIPASVEKMGYGLAMDCPDLHITTVPGSYAENWLLTENLDPTAQIERSLQEWRKFFNFSLRSKGARISGLNIDAGMVYIPDYFGKTAVALIDKEKLPKELIVLCSKTIFGKLPKSVKLCTALAFLHGDSRFTAEQQEYLKDFAKKNREEIMEICILQDDAVVLISLFQFIKKASSLWEAAFAMARESNAVNCVAMLLEYKHQHRDEFPKSDVFSLN